MSRTKSFAPSGRLGLLVCSLLLLALWVPGLQASPRAATASTAAEDDLIVERAMFLDDSGQGTIETIEDQPFRTVGKLVFFRNRSEPVWLRLRVKPAAEGDWALLLQPGFLHLATIYTQDASGAWASTQVGSRLAYRPRTVDSMHPIVPIRPDPVATTTAYIKLETAGAVVMVRALRVQDAIEEDHRIQMAMALYMGLAAVTFFVALVGWQISRVKFWLVSAAFDAVTLVTVLVYSGMGAKWLLPEAAGFFSWLHPFLLCIHALFGLLFFQQLIRLTQMPRWCEWGYRLAIGAAVMLIGLVLAGHPASALLMLNQWVLVGATAWGLIVLWFVRAEDALLRWLVRGLWLFAVAYLAVILLPWLAPFRPPAYLNLFPSIVVNVVTMVIAIVIAARYTQLLLRHRFLLEDQRREAEQQLELERARHDETSSFLAMLTHEVRNPLALIRQVIANLNRQPELAVHGRSLKMVDEAAEGVASILDRCQEVNRIDAKTLELQRSMVDVVDLTARTAADLGLASRISTRAPNSLMAHTDAAVLRLVMVNLLDNAQKYSPPDTALSIEVQPADDGFVELQVSNAIGPAGVPDEAMLFRRFYRAEGARHLPGSGLGLYWIRRALARLEGSIQMVQDRGQIRFRVRVPARTAQ